jgi:hypothetical protein
MKAYGGSGAIAPLFLTSALDGDEWSDSRLWPFYPQGNISLYPLDKRQGEPQSRSGRYEEKNLVPAENRIPSLCRLTYPDSFKNEPIGSKRNEEKHNTRCFLRGSEWE